VIKQGDWIASRKGLSLITDIRPLKVASGDERFVVEREDYFHHWWKQKHQLAFTPETCNSSLDFTWASSSPLFLVGRDGAFVDNFTSQPIMDDKGKQYVFKAGRFLPVFEKKSKVPFDALNTKEPFSTTHEDANGYLISDIYDPVNQVVLRVATKNDPVKWRILLSNGQEMSHKQPELDACNVQAVRTRLKIWGKNYNLGQMSVLLRYGIPYAATYGDMKLYFLKDK